MNTPIRVLIVEDSEDDTKLVLRALRQGGFDPTYRRVQNAEELAVELVNDRWDAVISDFRMPGFTGVDALRIFRSAGVDIPFILISGTMGEETAVAAMKAGANDYIMKRSLARLAPALGRELHESQIRAEHRLTHRELIESEERSRSLTATQATILNALPAHIALLDTQGIVISTNEAWRQFANSNGLHSPGCGIGLNYLEICDNARGDDSSEARQAAEGIRSVLSGAARHFSLEYSCHSPAEQRWFLMTATPLPENPPSGAVVMHVNITERRRSENELRRFRAAMDATTDAIYLVDRSSMRFVHINDAACRLEGQTRGDLLALEPWIAHATSRAELEQAYDAVIASDLDARPVEMLQPCKDGNQRWLEFRRHAQRTGDRWTIATLVRDVTERKEAEARIRRLNRVYAVLSGINTLIVRARDRDELFSGACRIAVEVGGFRLCWIGIVDWSAMKVVPVAHAGGGDAFVEEVSARLMLQDDAPAGHGITVTAVREKKVLVVNDASTDPRVSYRSAHARRGLRSLVSLPLLVEDQVVATFELHSSEIGFFDEAEMKLLRELAGNISFAIDHIDKQERLQYLAYYDALTGLANRGLFLERVAQHMRRAASGKHGLALFLVDLERFKNINDSLGQAAGDQLLRQVADWLARSAGDVSLLARVGADRFALVLPEVKQGGDLARLLEKTMAALQEQPFRLDDAVVRIAVKVGVALFPDDGADAATLFMQAEAALKQAKTSGDRYLFYTQNTSETAVSRLTLENQMREAVDKGEFVLHYQPKVDVRTGKLTGAEALIRWNDPQTGLVPPGRFIPILEETGLIHEVGRWALQQAIDDYLRWRAAGLAAVRIAVNVSPMQLRHRNFIAEIERAIGIDANAAAGLELELTESLIMADFKHSIASLRAIRAMSIRIAIDDFGTGFSSLSYLSKLPVDTLKIDRSFVLDMTAGPEGLALVSTIIDLAHSLKLKVVAEGVETEEQSRLLRLLSCDEIQGFLFGYPVPADTFETTYLTPRPDGGE